MEMDIGEKLRRLRQKNNLTQKELADRCDMECSEKVTSTIRILFG